VRVLRPECVRGPGLTSGVDSRASVRARHACGAPRAGDGRGQNVSDASSHDDASSTTVLAAVACLCLGQWLGCASPANPRSGRAACARARAPSVETITTRHSPGHRTKRHTSVSSSAASVLVVTVGWCCDNAAAVASRSDADGVGVGELFGVIVRIHEPTRSSSPASPEAGMSAGSFTGCGRTGAGGVAGRTRWEPVRPRGVRGAETALDEGG